MTDSPTALRRDDPINHAPIEEAERFLAAHPDIALIELFAIDANGVARGKWLHREELLACFRHGRALPSSIMSLSVHGEDIPESGLVWDVGDADGLAFPLAGSLQPLPWRRQAQAWVQVSLDQERGGPAREVDPRNVLIRAQQALQADGYTPVMAAELEFYLLDAEPDSHGRPQPLRLADGKRPDSPAVYDLDELAGAGAFLSALYEACAAHGLPARSAISEYAPGQFEITLEHRPCAVQAMDEAVRYKRLVKDIARHHGLRACFMAKPFSRHAGCGLHLHISLADRAGDNAFADPHPAGNALMQQAIAGLLTSAQDSLLLFCPHGNSFRRYQAESYAPLKLTWGVNNRTVALRVPAGPAASRHIEHRLCGADANPYLASAAVLAGIQHGIRHRLTPPAAVEGNGYRVDAPVLVPDWLTAIDRFAASAWVRDSLGDTFRHAFAAIKRAEHRAWQAEVGNQDWNWYLERA
ncbi:MAG: glutamine synthetase family protein [Xanthomonadaceae bacterium]|nr:glutamine synthetase family protein [Xanthomonadaceae bacterium]